jgi:two-component system LytT family sensor kinase
MTELNQPLLINILGHAGGALIFAIFLALLFSGRGWSGNRGRYLSGLAAALSLAWNLGSLVILTWPGLPSPALDLVVAFSFSVLSLLPAVLLHVSLEDSRSWIVRAGYVLSGIAIVMHFWEIAGNGATLHQSALLVITVGFLVLAIVAVVRPAVRARPSGFRVLASMCLALFATSFIHFGAGHASQVWSSELVFHHAGIPLALFVLLQDYRFVLLDAFVRFLANALLAAVLSTTVIVIAFRLVLVERPMESPLHEAALLISVCLLLVLFAWLRGKVQRWLTQAVFRRGGVSGLSIRVKDCPPFTSEGQYLDWAAALVAAAVRTRDFAIVDAKSLGAATDLHSPLLTDSIPSLRSSSQWSWTEAVVPVRRGPGDLQLILLGSRHGGQRYLSEDLDALGRTSVEISEHVEALRNQEMNRLVSQAELRALQSQINPHFLFNALNTLFGSIPREAPEARRMVLNLADIFRYFLQSDRTYVPLSREMQIVRAYLEVEQLRLGDRLRVGLQVDEAALDVPVPVLSVQPLVENAIKHGVAPNAEPGYVRVNVELRLNELRISVENSGTNNPPDGSGAGVGLRNVRRRLEICYGSAANLDLVIDDQKAIAEISIPIAAVATHSESLRK